MYTHLSAVMQLV